MKPDIAFYRQHACGIAVIVTVFALLIGRCNYALDYDGIWYGLRPDHLLNSGNGIYDRILAISTPNTYPKGYELLILPLSILPSYSFMLAFNIMIGLLILMAAYNTIRQINPSAAFAATTLIATIPGVMTMCTTVKQDSLTLLCQIIMICYGIKFLRQYDSKTLMIVFAAYILSLNMKTTSLVFSSAILLIVCIFALKNIKRIQWSKNGLLYVVMASVVMILLCIRTYLLCGYPYTSLLNSLWEALGLTAKTPYVIADPTGTVGIREILTDQGIQNTVLKLITAFVLPIKFESILTNHLLIAWGTPLTFIILVIVVCSLRKYKQESQRYILLLYTLILAFSVYSIASLQKNDGNYYMLLYVISVIAVVTLTKIGQMNKRQAYILLVPIVLCNILIFSLTGWAGQTHIFKVDYANRGYYNHKEVFREEMERSGKGEIYKYFSDNKISKVLAYGAIDIVDRLPCLVESAVEIYSYGGHQNFASYDSFVRMLEETKVSEIYIDDTYDYQMNDYFVDLIEGNRVVDIIHEGNNYILVLGDANSFPLSEEKKDFFMNKQTILRTQGELYQDGFLGKEAVVTLQSYKDSNLIVTVNNVVEIENQLIVFELGDYKVEVNLNSHEIVECVIPVPAGTHELSIQAKEVYKPDNGDLRALSVLLSLRFE